MRIRIPKSKLQRYMKRTLAFAAGLVALATPTVAWAQSCPLCYRAAAASKAGALQALRSGVLILMIPPVLIFGVVTLMAVRGRDRFNDAEAASGELPVDESLEAMMHRDAGQQQEEDRAWS